ncbi:MAG: ABC-F family ATP-binding cassette domain-containing protein [Agathobacter sp.]|nr:ABC-F family ATP-binding cassette domain-containing protein [Agathobacter sp.]MBQ6811906.1 ABC-F family ATP-binding cassette domain-containing protein [Agathobacter sp.]
MNIINVENITKVYTERELFSKASFYVQEREKIGIVGINGTGKSTLLKIAAGLEEPDEGSVIRANHVVINFLPQNPEFEGNLSVLDNVMNKIITTDMDEAHRWSLESEAKSLMLKLGISDFEQRCEELSGGQKKRLALVAAVLKPCDVLIMDEPTNHLDYDMVEWLEEFLRNWRGALLMVTHDRYFLDSVCNRIVEVDRGSIYSYDTNYSGFLALKAQREEYARASERKRQSILRKEIEWMQRGARARSTKQKAHIQRYEALRDQEGIKEVQKLEMSSLSTRLGRSTIEMNNISKAYGDTVCVKDFTYILLKGDRIGFVGKNGCGKTTLMKMIAGFLEPDSGSIEVGQTVKIGYYCQEIRLTTEVNSQTKESNLSNAGLLAMETAVMNPNQRVIDYIKDTAEYVRTEDGLVSASAMLERFLFPPEQQYSPIGKLSGGERRRLNLLRVLMEAPNVMILDEPTNDLDTETLAILEDYLDNYDGIVVTVSHDRYFLDRIAKRIFAFEGNGKITQYEGGYTDYMNKRPQEMNEISSVGVKSAITSDGNKINAEQKQDSRETWGHQKKIKFTFKEQKEYETIEADIEKLEAEIAAIDADMVKNATNAGKLNALSQEKEEKEALLMEKMERWEYLEELAEKIAEQG